MIPDPLIPTEPVSGCKRFVEGPTCGSTCMIGMPSYMKCCTNLMAMNIYNETTQRCCPDGGIVSLARACPNSTGSSGGRPKL